MRVVIDITDGSGDVPSEHDLSGTAESSTVLEGATTDGGAGPDVGTPGAEGGDGAVITDSGPPPEWLLDAVAAAESAGVQAQYGQTEPDDGAAADAGSGPDAHFHDD